MWVLTDHAGAFSFDDLDIGTRHGRTAYETLATRGQSGKDLDDSRRRIRQLSMFTLKICYVKE